MPSCLGIGGTPVGPGKDTHCTLGWPDTNDTNVKSRCNDASSKHSKTPVLRQTDSVACREYTVRRDEDSSEPKGWIRGNTKIGPVLEVATCCLQGKYGVEIRIKSMNKDDSHSWVRISHGLNKLVTNLNNMDQDDNNEQETSEKQSEEYALKLNASACASDQRQKQNHKDVILSAHPQKLLYLFGRELGLMLNRRNIHSSIIRCRRN